ncbi:hypothetical protein A5821_001751 [Enterococcus sp. 7F3_DIV0205]|uniref:N-acetyltransferase domain-containing protein n=1 Tax=Candidatus Enterococcus palustris TaxID=1834189 RepID=A0AAQ3WCA5_9ENTE|nr:GNAT family N-acetyltransferase [Enterococcus sp. 7F3_DIV0205]OTN86143.1 hypothetical protein A5821_002093 [Enterococcus sp. 7F3_DIV0205]
MDKNIYVVDRNQLNANEEKDIFRLLLASFSTMFAHVHLTSKEKLTILLHFEQNYSSQGKQLVDYMVKDSNEVIGVLTVSSKRTTSKNLTYPLELSKRYGYLTVFKYVLLLSALEYYPRDKEQYIENIAVHENYRKQGIGKALISAVQAKVKKEERLSLVVSVKNKQALNLYAACGFTIVKKEREFILGLLANEPDWFFMEWGR